jgi:hypothetical protein
MNIDKKQVFLVGKSAFPDKFHNLEDGMPVAP